jgi:hypothetical protein
LDFAPGGVKLREVIAEKYPDVTGLSAKKKDELVEIYAAKLGVEKHAHAELGIDRTVVKQKIRALKKERDEALEARDRDRLREIRHAIHKQKHILRRALKQAEIAAARGKS